MPDQTPPEDLMHYEAMAQDALRGVVKAALRRAASPGGLPGDHHFYITFRTKAPGVSGPQDLLGKYPDEMTIVLQHQYWELAVSEQSFEVGLSFNGVPERLLVPFTAIKSFVDPSVQFGLQFETQPRADAAVPATAEAPQVPAAETGPRAAELYLSALPHRLSGRWSSRRTSRAVPT